MFIPSSGPAWSWGVPVSNTLPKRLSVFLSVRVSESASSTSKPVLVLSVFLTLASPLKREHMTRKESRATAMNSGDSGCRVQQAASCVLAGGARGGPSPGPNLSARCLALVGDHRFAALIPSRACPSSSPGDRAVMDPTPTKQTWIQTCPAASVNM